MAQLPLVLVYWLAPYKSPPFGGGDRHLLSLQFLFFRIRHVQMGVEPKIGGFYPPKWMVKIMDPNPIQMDDLGFFPLFLETPGKTMEFSSVFGVYNGNPSKTPWNCNGKSYFWKHRSNITNQPIFSEVSKVR